MNMTRVYSSIHTLIISINAPLVCMVQFFHISLHRHHPIRVKEMRHHNTSA